MVRTDFTCSSGQKHPLMLSYKPLGLFSTTAAPLPLREADRKRPVLAHCSVCCSVSQQPDNMEVTALCLRLVLTVMVLLCARDQTLDAAVLHVVPNKLQFFEYEMITFHCEGDDVSSRWKVVHKFKGTLTSCNTSNGETTPTGLICTVKDSYPTDSGEYWCESGRKRTNSLHIVITAAVILESPALPLMEGDNVTLRCRNKNNSPQPPADFYKDGRFIWSSPTGEMTIHKLSLADEGLYKCNISGSGESPGSRLVITGRTQSTETAKRKCNISGARESPESLLPATELPTETPSSSHCVFLILRVVFITVVVLLLVVVGLPHCRKLRASRTRCVTCCAVTVGRNEEVEEKMEFEA